MDIITAQMLLDKYAEASIKRWEYGSDVTEEPTYIETVIENLSYYADDPDADVPMEPWEYFMEWLEPAEDVNDDELFVVTSAILELMCRLADDDEKWIVEFDGTVLLEGTPDAAREKFPIEA